MGATKFEFEQRFWIIGLIFWFGFGLYWVDHTQVAAALLHWLAPSLNPDSTRAKVWLQLIFACGALLIFAAAAFRTWATAYLRTEIVHDAAQHSENVVADGPYRHTRNPLYLANLPLAAGFALMASRLGAVVMIAGMWLFMYRLILREEDGLLREQGVRYAKYVQAVPRLWPSFRARIPSTGLKPRWPQAFAGESIFWLFGVAVLSFAVTLLSKVFFILLALSFVAYFIAVRATKKRAAGA